jgi:hypothetical protein
MDRLSLLGLSIQGPKTRKEIMANGIQHNVTFRVLVIEMAREGFIRFPPETEAGTITPLGRREMSD